MKKKVVALFLAAAMVLGVSACGNKTNEGTETKKNSAVAQSSEQKESASEAEEEKSLYPIVDEPITVTGLVIGKDMTNKSRVVWDKVSEITGIQIEWINVEGDAFATYLAGSDWPDFFAVSASAFGAENVYDYGVEAGKLVDYSKHLDIMPNYAAALEEFPAAKKAITQENGGFYELVGFEKSVTMNRPRAHYRNDILEKLGLKVPETVEELYDVMTAVKEANDGKAPFCYYGGFDENTGWGSVLYCAFGDSVQPDFEDDGNGNVIFNRTSEQYKHYLEYMHKLYDDGLLNQEYLTLDGNAALSLAKEGTTVFLGNEAGNLPPDDFEDGEVHLDVLAPLTSEYSDSRQYPGRLPMHRKSVFYMNAESSYVEEMCKMFDIMYAREEVVEGSGLYGNSFCYGLEGVNWEFDSDETYAMILPEGYTGTFGTYQYSELIWDNSGYVDFSNRYTSTPGNNQVRQKAYMKNLVPYMKDANKMFPDEYLTFTTDEQYVIMNKWSEIKTYFSEMKTKFIAGVADLDTQWDEYCKTIESMGIGEVLEVYQAAYDRWNEM